MRAEQEELDRLLADFVRRDFQAARDFRRVASPIIRGLARRFGPHLPADLIDDVVSETYVLLLGRSGRRFDPRLGSARQFLFGVVQNAVKNVRAQYRPAGFPSRYGEDHFAAAQQVVAFDESIYSTDSGIPIVQIESNIDLAKLLTGISTLLAAAIIAIYVHGEKSAIVARRLGVSRFQIYRTLQSIRAHAFSQRMNGSNTAVWRAECATIGSVA